jgi:hypothetical protein
MKKYYSLSIGMLFVFLFALAFVTPRTAIAQEHVVAPSNIQKDVAASSSARQKNQSQLENFVSSPEAQKALKSAHLDANKVKNAIPSLDDEELADLSARSEKAQADFAAGRISDRDLIIILLAVVALILIIVAVR